jgi:hypothetical protein
MRALKLTVALGLVMLLAGCVPSLHPLYTEEDLVYDPALVGTWTEEDSEDTWTFRKLGDTAYDLIYTEEGVPARFEAHLVQVGEFLFLDTYPGEPDIKNDFYLVHIIPAHIFLRIEIEGDVLRYAMLDLDWLKKMIAENKVDIRHEEMEGGILLTAQPEELQTFLAKYAENEKAFPDPQELHRVK